MNSRLFHITAVLSVTSGRLLTDIEDVVDILNYVTQDDLMTDQIPRATRDVTPNILKFYPQLEDLDITGLDATLEESEDPLDACKEWALETSKRIGLPEMVRIFKMPKGDYKRIDPLDEMRAMKSDSQIIIAEIPGDIGADQADESYP